MGKSLTGKELGKGIRQRESGIYTARFTDRFGNRKEIYNKNLAELKRQLKAAQREDIREENVKGDITLNQWFEMWMSVYKRHLRNTSAAAYTTAYNTMLKNALGEMSLPAIKPIMIQQEFNRVSDNGVSTSSLKHFRMILKGMFEQAVIDEYIVKNPMARIIVSGAKKEEKYALTAQEELLFFSAASGSFFEDAYIVQATTGLRPGELFALTPADIDFERREIRVRRTLVYLTSGGPRRFEFNPPKTATSNRSVPFGSTCEQALLRQIERKKQIESSAGLCVLPECTDLLFVSKNNWPLCASTYNKSIGRIVAKHNKTADEASHIPVFTGHCFRHSFATRCFEAGVDLKVVQKLLGHSTLAMTADIYTHVSEAKIIDEHKKFLSQSAEIFGKVVAINAM